MVWPPKAFCPAAVHISTRINRWPVSEIEIFFFRYSHFFFKRLTNLPLFKLSIWNSAHIEPQGMFSEWINNGERDPCIMDEETLYPSAEAKCVFTNVQDKCADGCTGMPFMLPFNQTCVRYITAVYGLFLRLMQCCAMLQFFLLVTSCCDCSFVSDCGRRGPCSSLNNRKAEGTRTRKVVSTI